MKKEHRTATARTRGLQGLAMVATLVFAATPSLVPAAPPVAGADTFSPLPSNTPTLIGTIPGGADGNVFAFNPVDGLIYQLTGNSTPLFQKFAVTSPGTPTNIPLTGPSQQEVFGLAWVPAMNAFLGSNISSKIFKIDAAGVRTDIPGSALPDDFRGFALVGDRVFATSPFRGGLYEINPTTGNTIPYLNSPFTTAGDSLIGGLQVVIDGVDASGTTAITHDPVTKSVFAIIKKPAVTSRVLARVNVRTGIATSIGETGDKFSTLTIAPDGRVFGGTGQGGTVKKGFFSFPRATVIATEDSGPLTFTGLLANDTDPDVGDTLTTVAVAPTPSALGVTVEIFGDGSFSYDPSTAPALQALAQDELATDTFNYTVRDQNAETGAGVATVLVAGINDAPVVDLDGAGGGIDFRAAPVILDAPTTVKIADADATVSDPDTTDKILILTATLSGVLDGASETLTATASGGADKLNFAGNVLTVSASGGFAPRADFEAVLRSITYENAAVTRTVGTRTITVQVDDGLVKSAIATSRVSVTTRPVLTLPTSPILLDPDGPSGAVANFTATATDAEDGALMPVSVPASGSTFPLGDTVVTITATDSDGATASGQITVSVNFVRPSAPLLQVGAKAGPVMKGVATGSPVPGAGGGGIPAGATFGTFFTPAVSNYRDLAARATMLVGTKRLDAIYVEDRKGVGRVVAFVGKQADGFPFGVKYKSFRDPLLGEDQTITFSAKVTGGTVKPTGDEAVWTSAFGALAPVLTEGKQAPGLPVGVLVKSVTSISPRTGELLALVKLAGKAPAVTAKTDTALLLLTGPATATKLVRTGDVLGTAKVASIGAFLPGPLTKGQGGTHAETGVVVRVKNTLGQESIVVIGDGGGINTLLTTGVMDAMLNAQATKIGIPTTGGTATAARVTVKLTPTGKALNSLVFTPTNAPFTQFLTTGDQSPDNGANFASFGDPVVNDRPRMVFSAKIVGTGTKAPTNTGLFAGNAGLVFSEIVRSGDKATNPAGADLVDTVWTKFTGYALPDGPGAGVIFTAEVSGKAVTAATKLGIWAEDSGGAIRLLLRTGDDLTVAPSVTKKLKSFRLLDALPGSFGSRRSYDAVGSVAVLATFTDKSQALVRLIIP